MTWRRNALAAAAVVIASFAFVSSASAATILVDTQADQFLTDPTHCSLREAILSANFDNAGGHGCVDGTAGNDTITFAPALTDQTLQLTNLDNGEVLITSPMTITGPGMNHLTITGPAGKRAIEINGAGIIQVGITGLNVQNNSLAVNDEALGGGIRNDEDLTLTDVKVADNTATATGVGSGNTSAAGGGIYSSGTLTLNNSVVTGNTAAADNPLLADAEANAQGGGIQGGDATTITNSTIDDNHATATDEHGSIVGNAARAFGGGIANLNMTMSHSTVSDNVATANSPEGPAFVDGGGIKMSPSGPNPGNVSIESSTIAGNQTVSNGFTFNADEGGGIIGFGGTLSLLGSTVAFNGPDTGSHAGANLFTNGATPMTLKSTIVASPRGAASTNCDASPTTTSSGFNVDYSLAGASCVLSQTTDLHTDPMLATSDVVDNGGPTKTIALSPGSPAIDKGSSVGQTDATHDQRGLARPVDSATVTGDPGDGSDIGAVEAQAPDSPTLTATTPASPSTTDFTPNVLGATPTGTPEADATGVTIYSDSSCTAALGTDTDTVFASPGIGVTVPQNATTTLYATAVNAFGIPSVCSSTLVSNGSIPYTNDSLGPVLTIDSGPTDSTDRTPTFAFHGTDLSPPITYTCSVDTGTPAFSACASPFTSASLGDGSYTFRVRGSDSLGNPATSATQAFTITTPVTPPSTTPTPAPKHCKKGQKLKKGKCVKKKHKK